jgi:hypothetical protein
MSIYINKNNQQSGPFDEAQILEMLNSGQLSPNDFAIRQGGSQWQKLSEMFPHAGGAQPQFAQPSFGQAAADAPAASRPAAAAEAKPKKSRKGLLIGCLGILLFSGLVLAIVGFLAFRNLRPAESKENLPDAVKDFKLGTRYPPKGNIWGTETNYVGLYSRGSDSVLYLLTEYADETAARNALNSEISKSCRTGEKPMYFGFMKDGKEISQGATCAVPLYVQKDNKLIALGGAGAGADDFIEFAENLPFNNGATMTKKEMLK